MNGTSNDLKASILIPVFDDVHGLEVTLESLRQRRVQNFGAEVIVCNDGGGSQIAECASRYGHQVAALATNQGSYAARNAGVRIARGDVFVFLDANESVDENWLESGLAELQHADYVGGQVVVMAEPDEGFWKRFDHMTAFPVDKTLQDTHFAPTANLFVRRLVFETVGLFRAELQSGGDREFGERVHNGGFKQSYCRLARTYHPARGLREQLGKWKRVASGFAEIKLGVSKDPPLRFLLYAGINLARSVLQLGWRPASYFLNSIAGKRQHDFGTVLASKTMKVIFWLHVVWHTLVWVLSRRSRAFADRAESFGTNNGLRETRVETRCRLPITRDTGGG